MECLSYSIAERFELGKLEKPLKEKLGVKINRHDRVLEVIYPDAKSSLYIFANGTLISWGLKRYQARAFFPELYSCATTLLKTPIFDGFSYRLGDKTTIFPHDYFNIECILLENEEQDLKLSISYAISLSIKLKSYENDLESLIEKHTPLMMQLREAGQLKLSQQKIRQTIGDVLIFKSRVNLNSSFLYMPKFFWQHPALESYFLLIRRYLDIDERAKAINHQLNTLNEIFVMCNSYSENKHSHRIEIIIVILIFLEILFYILNLHLT